MKKVIIILLIFASSGAFAQFNPTFDTVKFLRGGKIYQLITYSDSVKINGTTYVIPTGQFVNFWQPDPTAGPRHIQPKPRNTVLHYPAIQVMNGSNSPNASSPVWWRLSDSTLRAYSFYTPDVITTDDTITGCEQVYMFSAQGVDVVLNIDSIQKICGCFTVKNSGLNSELTITSLQGLLFDTISTISLAYGQSVNICPATTKFITTNSSVFDSASYYQKTVADARFAATSHTQAQNTITKLTDTLSAKSIHRYTAYSSGSNNVEVLSMGTGITASIANTNELTFTIPSGVKLISSKIRVSGLSSLVIVVSGDMVNDSAANRWMPAILAWREDTGNQLTGISSRMNMADFTKSIINGLISTTICQIRIVY